MSCHKHHTDVTTNFMKILKLTIKKSFFSSKKIVESEFIYQYSSHLFALPGENEGVGIKVSNSCGSRKHAQGHVTHLCTEGGKSLRKISLDN